MHVCSQPTAEPNRLLWAHKLWKPINQLYNPRRFLFYKDIRCGEVIFQKPWVSKNFTELHRSGRPCSLFFSGYVRLAASIFFKAKKVSKYGIVYTVNIWYISLWNDVWLALKTTVSNLKSQRCLELTKKNGSLAFTIHRPSHSMRVAQGYPRDAWLADYIFHEIWNLEIFFVTLDLKVLRDPWRGWIITDIRDFTSIFNVIIF